MIAQTTFMVSIMHEFGLRPHIRGRDNLGGAIIGTGLPAFSQEYVDLLIDSFLANTFLYFDATSASDLMDHTGLIEVLTEWCQNYGHHKKDPGHNTGISACITDYGIVTRNLRGQNVAPCRDNLTDKNNTN
jgi:hypothetical protein